MKEDIWTKDFPAAITVCDANGVIVDMNDAACRVFGKYGGADLVGQSLMNCHNEASRAKLREMLDTRQPNVYTIEKDGRKKMIYQSPWYKGEEFGGLVEISLPLPDEMPHFKRN